LCRCSTSNANGNDTSRTADNGSTTNTTTTTTTETKKEAAGDGIVSPTTTKGIHHHNRQQQQRQRRERHRRRGVIARVDRKVEQNAERLRGVLNDLEELLFLFDNDEDDDDDEDGRRRRRHRHEEEDVKAVLITLGPSFASPREQYLLRFHSWPRRRRRRNTNFSNRSCRSGVCNGMNGIATTATTSEKQIAEIQQHQQQQQQQQQEQQRKRMEQEIGRRSVREFIQGALSEEHSKTFETSCSGSSSGGAGGSKVNIAVLLTKDTINSLFNSTSVYSSPAHCNGEDGYGTTNTSPPDNDNMEHAAAGGEGGGTSPVDAVGNVRKRPHSILVSSAYGGGTTNSTVIVNRIVIRRNFDVKTPRIVSKRRNLHRPFVVFDVVPMMKPSSDLRMNEEGEEKDGGGVGVGTEPKDEGIPDVGFRLEDGDTWVSLRSFIKGFRI